MSASHGSAHVLQKYWNDAQVKPEWATTKFWEYVFNHVAFRGDAWTVHSQQPPTEEDDEPRRVDLVVARHSSQGMTSTLLFVELKRASAPPNQVDEVEYQAFTACCAYLRSTGLGSIWAMTCVGTKARLWAYKQGDDYLTAFYPEGEGLSDMTEYAEYSTHSRQILEAMDSIKRNPAPPGSVFNKPPSPRPSNPVLPPGWHDSEVPIPIAAPPPHQAHGTGWAGASHQQRPLAMGGQGAFAEAQGSFAEGQGAFAEGHGAFAEAQGAFAEAQGASDQAGLSQMQWQESAACPDQPLDARQCILLRFVKVQERTGKWAFVDPNGTQVGTAPERWSSCTILASGGLYDGFSYTGTSGSIYYAWELPL